MIITVSAMGTILAGIGDVVSAITGVVGSIITCVVAQPLLLIPVLVGFIGMGFSLFKKLRNG